MLHAKASQDHKRILKQHQKECNYVTARIAAIKANDMQMAEADDIYSMNIEQFLKWFDTNSPRLFQSVAYSRIKNKSMYSFRHYIARRRKIRNCKHRTSVSLVRANSRLRASFSVHNGPARHFGSTMLFAGALTIQELPFAQGDLQYCIQFSVKFHAIVDQFLTEHKPDAVMRALQDAKSTAIYHIQSKTVYSY